MTDFCNVNVNCRFCNVNLLQHGVVHHAHVLFKSGDTTLVSELQKLGVHVRNTPSMSQRICQGCHRQIPRLQKAYDTIQKWMAAERADGQAAASAADQQSPPAAQAAVSEVDKKSPPTSQQPKRSRNALTPTKTPRKAKKVALSSSPPKRTPTKLVIPKINLKAKIDR